MGAAHELAFSSRGTLAGFRTVGALATRELRTSGSEPPLASLKGADAFARLRMLPTSLVRARQRAEAALASRSERFPAPCALTVRQSARLHCCLQPKSVSPILGTTWDGAILAGADDLALVSLERLTAAGAPERYLRARFR